MDHKTLPQPAPIPADRPAVAEHAVLLRHLAAVQRRCSDLITRQAQEIARLEGETMKLRASLIASESALAWAAEDRAALEAAIPDLAPRATLSCRVKELSRKLQELMREKMRPAMTRTSSPKPIPALDEPALSDLEASIVAADLVICQTGCLSHGAYWRVQDHCKRTGKTCVMVEQAANFRVVRIHRDMRAEQDRPGERSQQIVSGR